ncbi:MAG: cysteine-rich CWC family protein [Pyrinomonadaceae bacterium]
MQKSCSNCGKDFHCGAARAAANAGEDLSCWCTELPRVGVVAGADQDCLCPECLSEAIGKLAKQQQLEL